MLQRESFKKKSKKFLKRTLHSLKHLVLFDGYQKLRGSPSFRGMACASCRELCCRGSPRTRDSYVGGSSGKWSLAEESYPGFSGRWTQIEGAKVEGKDLASGSIIAEKMVYGPKEEEEAMKVEKVKMGSSHHSPPPPPSQRGGGGGLVLAKKMKELEMMEVGDMEHVLDVEEAIHYYSRITSPIYAGIVDKFFMDMYFDFSPSAASEAQKPAARDSRMRRGVDRTMR
ncbi:hypothetical protein SAY87_002120 [Trapa incisa]|uniref:Uncharacterized protein n=1 Tax=Trapa incisa TaxID=236973 RepID=A0AAN7JUD4_9MYRT|nr:hypothetical protein SAY87_002120 [Trapa incisa]